MKRKKSNKQNMSTTTTGTHTRVCQHRNRTEKTLHLEGNGTYTTEQTWTKPFHYT